MRNVRSSTKKVAPLKAGLPEKNGKSEKAVISARNLTLLTDSLEEFKALNKIVPGNLAKAKWLWHLIKNYVLNHPELRQQIEAFYLETGRSTRFVAIELFGGQLDG